MASMPSITRTLVIIPAWNEEAALPETIREIKQAAPHCDILVVDDGSTDGTRQSALSSGVNVLSLPFNLGVGGAMRAGFKYASWRDYDAVIQVDADGQHDPRDIGRVLEGLDRADIAIGARFADRGSYEVRGPRKWAMQFLAGVMSRLAKSKLTDVTSGFRAGNRRAIRQYLEHYPAEYLGDTIDSLVVAIRSGCSVTQVPVEMRPRQAGVPSHNPLKSTIYLARSGMALLLALTRKRTAIPSTESKS
ncbi:glycosyltransferase family 2 protein [Arthrobacter sp.]|uniref:glycosyltransferase family 2 protein n=1 Tax=Arthrobacter sp. TaxID=1667 RepID=UPI0028A1BF0F|nr:glycosyltransferase family 2 protein [Arthrobacter sp.]